MFLENLQPVFEKVFPESLVLCMIGLQQSSEEASNFFGFLGKRNRFA
jgi:hypothetical protein